MSRIVEVLFFVALYPAAMCFRVWHWLSEFKTPRFKQADAMIAPDNMLRILKEKR